MINVEDIQNYLPQYLFPKTNEKLLSDLNQFPSNIDGRLFGFEGKKEDIIYQGDGIDNLLIINLPDEKKITGRALIISNTCDTDTHNERKFASHIIYAPIINLEKYKTQMESKGVFNQDGLKNHIKDIRNQAVTQVFYLPQWGGFEESLVFLDRVISIRNDYYDRARLRDHRLFSLSQYGHYLFLYKLSIHFTRFNEKVERK
jgi:hypothetical protein